jgi:putative membrane protein
MYVDCRRDTLGRLILGLCFGAALLGLLLAANGIAPALKRVLAAGPALLLLVPLHILPLLFDVFGWQDLLPHRVATIRLLWIAVIREAVDGLLPLAHIRGAAIGIRMLVKSASADGPTAIAGVTVKTLLTLLATCLFLVVGAICLLEVATDSGPLTTAFVILSAVVLMALACGMFWGYSVLLDHIARAGERFLGRAITSSLFARSRRIYIAIEIMRSHPTRLSQSLAWQLASLMAGCAETWLALHWFGIPVNLPEAFALESVTQAIRRFVFLIPAGLGVQEMGLVGVGHLVGLDPNAAIALSAVKRMREAAIGIPALLMVDKRMPGESWRHG